MIVGLIIEAIVGAAIITLGILIWVKRKVSLIHEYQYKNVDEKDVPAYTKLVGIGQLIIGTGICLAGLIRIFTRGKVYLAALAAGFVFGLIVLNKAQQKYNGSWFG